MLTYTWSQFLQCESLWFSIRQESSYVLSFGNDSPMVVPSSEQQGPCFELNSFGPMFPRWDLIVLFLCHPLIIAFGLCHLGHGLVDQWFEDWLCITTDTQLCQCQYFKAVNRPRTASKYQETSVGTAHQFGILAGGGKRVVPTEAVANQHWVWPEWNCTESLYVKCNNGLGKRGSKDQRNVGVCILQAYAIGHRA